MIKQATIKESRRIANLHMQTLSKGFLSKMGSSFLNHLYIYLIRKELVFISKDGDNVKGFVAISLKSKKLMKRFFLSSPIGIFNIICLIIKRPELLFRVLEIVKAPVKYSAKRTGEVNVTFPEAELLSIAVDPIYQKEGIGSKLILSLEKNLLNKGITCYKVVAGEKLREANAFYLKNGFKLASQIIIHGDNRSNVYIKEL